MTIQIPMETDNFKDDLTLHMKVIADYLRRVELSLGESQNRYNHKERSAFGTPESIVEYIHPQMVGLLQEQLRVILLSTKMKATDVHIIYQGTVSSITIRTTEILRPAIVANAPKIVMVHNHPSGDPTPSPEDIMVTRKVSKAAEIMELELVDHIIVTDDPSSFYSFKRDGKL